MSSHGIDIANRIGRRNLSKFEGVIHDRCKKIGGAQQGSAITNIDGRGIIAATVAYQQRGCAVLECIDFHRRQNFSKRLGRQFAATPSRRAELCQLNRV